MTRAAFALLASTAAAYAAPPCPIEAPALARLRSEHAAMDAAGLACLTALDAARSERDRCTVAAATAADAFARDLASGAASLDAAQTALALRVEPGRPWALVAIGGAVAAGAAGAVVALEGGAVEAAGAGLGAALVAAGLAAVVAWALD